MGYFKRLDYQWKCLGWRPGKGEAEYLGIGPRGGPLPPEEELEAAREARAVARESAREARAERAAIQAVEREADEEHRRAVEASKPRVFAADSPDFPRSGRTLRVDPPAVNPEPERDCEGLAVEWPRMAEIAAADRRTSAEIAAGRVPPALAALREVLGPPEPPETPTGWYRCGDGYARVGSGPWPEYRPPGLTWRSRWLIPKPDDVAWDDDAPAALRPKYLEPEVAARVDEYRSELLVKDRRLREPTGKREPVGKLDQLRFGW